MLDVLLCHRFCASSELIAPPGDGPDRRGSVRCAASSSAQERSFAASARGRLHLSNPLSSRRRPKLFPPGSRDRRTLFINPAAVSSLSRVCVWKILRYAPGGLRIPLTPHMRSAQFWPTHRLDGGADLRSVHSCCGIPIASHDAKTTPRRGRTPESNFQKRKSTPSLVRGKAHRGMHGFVKCQLCREGTPMPDYLFSVGKAGARRKPRAAMLRSARRPPWSLASTFTSPAHSVRRPITRREPGDPRFRGVHSLQEMARELRRAVGAKFLSEATKIRQLRTHVAGYCRGAALP